MGKNIDNQIKEILERINELVNSNEEEKSKILCTLHNFSREEYLKTLGRYEKLNLMVAYEENSKEELDKIINEITNIESYLF